MKIFIRRLSFSLALATLVVTFPDSAHAATFAEGLPDAGQTLGTAKLVNTSAFGTSLDTIIGTISVGLGKADLFQIYLTGNTFSANTNRTAGSSAMVDTQLFLFDASGVGVYWDDDAGTDYLSQFSISDATAGVYYLGISGFDYDPVSAGGRIFSDSFGSAIGPGGALPLKAWAFTPGIISDRGTYSIALEGATFVPEPSEVLGLLAFTSLGCGAFLKRRLA